MIQTLTLTRPDDWHLHLRDGDALAAVHLVLALQAGGPRGAGAAR